MNAAATKAWDAVMALDSRERSKLLAKLIRSLSDTSPELGRVSRTELVRRANASAKTRPMADVLTDARRSLRRR